MSEPMFKSIRNSPPMPITEAVQGIVAIEDKILKLLADNEPAHLLPSQPMLEWIEVGGFTCMRVNLVDEVQADADGFSPILASALVLADVIQTEPAYPQLIAHNLRLSLHLMDGRVPTDVVQDW